MTGTVTFVGLDVHARSTHAVAVDVMTGELTRVRFGEGLLAPITWLGSLPSPGSRNQGPGVTNPRISDWHRR
jgi:transposase